MLQLRGSISDVGRALFTHVYVGEFRHQYMDEDEHAVFLRRRDAVRSLTTWLGVAGDSLLSLTFRPYMDYIDLEEFAGYVECFETKLFGSAAP